VRPADNNYHVKAKSHHQVLHTRTTALREVTGHAVGEREARDEKWLVFLRVRKMAILLYYHHAIIFKFLINILMLFYILSIITFLILINLVRNLGFYN